MVTAEIDYFIAQEVVDLAALLVVIEIGDEKRELAPAAGAKESEIYRIVGSCVAKVFVPAGN